MYYRSHFTTDQLVKSQAANKKTKLTMFSKGRSKVVSSTSSLGVYRLYYQDKLRLNFSLRSLLYKKRKFLKLKKIKKSNKLYSKLQNRFNNALRFKRRNPSNSYTSNVRPKVRLFTSKGLRLHTKSRQRFMRYHTKGLSLRVFKYSSSVNKSLKKNLFYKNSVNFSQQTRFIRRGATLLTGYEYNNLAVLGGAMGVLNSVFTPHTFEGGWFTRLLYTPALHQGFIVQLDFLQRNLKYPLLPNKLNPKPKLGWTLPFTPLSNLPAVVTNKFTLSPKHHLSLYKKYPVVYTKLNPKSLVGRQLLYNTIQSLLLYKNVFVKQMAMSKSASLILSFETKTTRLSTLPIFLELRKHSFGRLVNPPTFSYVNRYLSNYPRNYFTDSWNPITALSPNSLRTPKFYSPKQLRPVTLSDKCLRLTKIGPKVRPLRGLQPAIRDEFTFSSGLSYRKNQLYLSYKKRYSVHRQLENRLTKLSLVKLKRSWGYVRPSHVRTLWVLHRRNTLYNTLLKNTVWALCSTAVGLIFPESKFDYLWGNYKLINYKLGTYKLRKKLTLSKRIPRKGKVRKKPLQSKYRKLLPLHRNKTLRRNLCVLRRRKPYLVRRSRKFFKMISRQIGLYQRRSYLKYQQSYNHSDFKQSSLNPDELVVSPKLVGLQRTLSSAQGTYTTGLSSSATTLTNLFTTKSPLIYSKFQLLLLILHNPFFLKLFIFYPQVTSNNLSLINVGSGTGLTNYSHKLLDYTFTVFKLVLGKFTGRLGAQKFNLNLLLTHTNLLPNKVFASTITKRVSSLYLNNKLRENFIPIYFHTLIRFSENISGKRCLFQFYPFLHQNITLTYIVKYKQWIPKMKMYERRLGHKFFFEESLHIMHLSFILRDSVLFSSWLKTIIKRISFWKTRLVFRFVRYLFINFFGNIFPSLGVKGIKLKLKGKISVGGNSRKRTIVFTQGKTSFAEVNLRVSHHKQTIGTFTGVQGLQVWIFY